MNILIVDDHPLVRSGVRVNMQAAIADAVISEAGSVEEACEMLDGDTFDVVTLDLRLGGDSGIDVAQFIADNNLKARCVVLTSFGSPHAIISAFNTGSVSAFLEKGVDIAPVIEAVQNTHAGLASLTTATVRAAVESIREAGGYDPTQLTEREQSIVELIAAGLSDADIANELCIAGSTVRNNLTSIYKKLDVDSRTRLAALVWDSRANVGAFS